jgi:predicted transposase YdaD
VVYLLPPPEGTKISAGFHEEFMGLTAHQDFCVVKVWEQDPWQVLKEGALALVPFVPLMRGADATTIRAGAELIHQHPGLEDLETVLALFASFVLDPEQVKQVLRWDMAVLRESPWYQEILKEGRQEGLVEGRQEGLEEGRREGLMEGRRESLLGFLVYRFGPVPERLKSRLAVRSLPELELLFNAAMDVKSLEAFDARLTALEQGQA